MDMEPGILFEDNHCLIIDKPAGLATQAPEPFPSLESWARNYLKQKYNKAGRPYLGIPHRLDRPVSGAVFFTRSSKAAARVAEQFRERIVSKRYLALVEGIIDPNSSEYECFWRDYISKVPNEPRAILCRKDDPGAQLAELETKFLKSSENKTLLEINLHTGRMHQIRLQSSSRGFPIVGDSMYGSKENIAPTPSEKRILLHSHYLRFLHPINYKPVEIHSGLPGYFPQWASDFIRNDFYSAFLERP